MSRHFGCCPSAFGSHTAVAQLAASCAVSDYSTATCVLRPQDDGERLNKLLLINKEIFVYAAKIKHFLHCYRLGSLQFLMANPAFFPENRQLSGGQHSVNINSHLYAQVEPSASV